MKTEEDELLRVNYMISKHEVKHNNMSWTEIDFLHHHLRQVEAKEKIKTGLGWFAMKETDTHFEFKCCEHGKKLNKKYLEALQEDGYVIAYSVN